MTSRLEVLSEKSAPELKESVYYKDMLKTKEMRVAYTSNYLSARLYPNYNPEEFLKKAAKLLGLKNPSDDTFFNVFYIQTKLGFPLIPKSERRLSSGFPTSIDVKFGPYTHENLLRNSKCESLKKYFKEFYKDKRKKFAQTQNLPSEPVASTSPKKRPGYATPGLAPLALVPAIISRPERRKRGGLPFEVRTGGYMSDDQYATYRKESRVANSRYKMDIVDRMKSFQKEYDYIEALKVCIKMLGIPKSQWKVFLAFVDATARTESGYNVMCTPGTGWRRGGEGNRGLKKVWSDERGMFQIFDKYYSGSGGIRANITNRKRIPGVNYDALSGIEMPAVKADNLSLFHHTIAFLYQYAASWRRYKGMHMGDIFEQIANAPNDRMKKQWAAMLYLRHRNGVNGSSIFRTLLQQGILFPENPSEARAYFDKYLKDKTWQGRRPFADFHTLVRQTMGDEKKGSGRFLQRFMKNMRELENVDVDELFKTS